MTMMETGPSVAEQAPALLGQVARQRLPRRAYDDLLTRHGFVELGSVELTPVHALTWGRRP